VTTAPARRVIEHGKRTGFGSLTSTGINFDSLPMRLFTKGNARHWNPADIDFTQDARDYAAMTDDEKWATCSFLAQFMAGEESVTQDLQPFVAAMAAEGRLNDEMYLTQFVYEEAKHCEAFRRWFDAVGVREDLHHYIETNESYMLLFTKELPESLYALQNDPSPHNQIRASATYNHVIEGTLALTGYYGVARSYTSRGLLPGLQQVIKFIGDDERRHMAWGTFTCRRHVAADDGLWQVFTDRMQELMPAAMGVVQGSYDHFEGRERPFEIPENELMAYAGDRLGRRIGAIESARGADVQAIDMDASPDVLEEEFYVEDQAAMAGAAS
jgi:ribonucleoside-diphosphate reductase beta chain